VDLTPELLMAYRRGQEGEQVITIRQLATLGNLATDAEVQMNIETRRLRVANASKAEIGRLLCQVMDYNLHLLCSNQETTSSADMEQSRMTSEPWEVAALISRVCQRETLAMWRYAICKQYDLPTTVGPHCLVQDACLVCGRTYPHLFEMQNGLVLQSRAPERRLEETSSGVRSL